MRVSLDLAETGRWREAEDLFQALAECNAQERSARLDPVRARDLELCESVEALLGADRRADEVLRRFDELLVPGLHAAAETDPAGGSGDPYGLVGRTVVHYRVSQALGSGGMGVVYQAEDVLLRRAVALKLLPPALDADSRMRRRFVLEARAASAVDHPNVCAIHEIGETADGRPFIVMACCKGKTLKGHMAGQALPVAEALEIALQVAEGLAAVHRRGIVHGDVKPANLMLTDGGVVKIVDFGLATLGGGGEPRPGWPLGTLAYMSPEQVRSQALGPASDLWALGVTLYEMLTGRRPFPGEDRESLAGAILHDAPEPPAADGREVPEPLQRVVLRLLSKEPNDRYRDAGELREELRGLAAAPAPAATAGPTPHPTPHPAPAPGDASLAPDARRRARWLAAATAVAVAAAAWAIWWVRGPLGARDPAVRRLAVLPLVNRTGDAGQQYFVDGMHEALIGELGQAGGAELISPASVQRYRETELTLPEIARQLDADAVVTGSVARQAETVTITLQLTQASPERQLWSRSYRDSAEGTFRMTHQMARSIDARLTSRQGPTPAASPAVDPLALDAFLMGRFHFNQRTAAGFDLAIKYLERAIALDPSFAPAHSGLAEAYSARAYWGLVAPREGFPKAAVIARRALALDPSLAEAQVALAAPVLFFDWRWSEAEGHLRRALELNPNSANAHRILYSVLAATGRHREAVAEAARTRDLDPLSPVSDLGEAYAHYLARQYDPAIARARVAVDFDPGFWQGHYVLGLAYAGKGWDTAATRAAEEAVARSGQHPLAVSTLGLAHALAGRRDLARRELERLRERSAGAYVAPSLLAIVHGALGELDRAFAELDHAYTERDTWLIYLGEAPFFDPLRPDPRFDRALARMRFAD